MCTSVRCFSPLIDEPFRLFELFVPVDILLRLTDAGWRQPSHTSEGACRPASSLVIDSFMNIPDTVTVLQSSPFVACSGFLGRHPARTQRRMAE